MVTGVLSVGLAGLTRCGSWEVFLVLRAAAFIVIDLAQSSALGVSVVGGCGNSAVACTLLGGNTGRGDRGRLGHLLAHAVLKPPLAEGTLVEMQPMLLGANNHTGAHESHESNDLVRSKSIAVDEVGTDQASSATKTGLAVNSDTLFFGNHIMGKLDKLAYKLQRRASSILENHVDVGDSHCCEV